MSNLTLQQIEKLGMTKWMNEKERNKAIEKALQEQLLVLESQNDHTPKKNTESNKPNSLTLEKVLVSGGLFTYNLKGKKYKLNVLTKADLAILDNAENNAEAGIEYDITKPFRYHIKNSHDNFVTIKAKTYEEAQQVIDDIYSKGLYKVSASTL
jgi:hypothetical protein